MILLHALQSQQQYLFRVSARLLGSGTPTPARPRLLGARPDRMLAALAEFRRAEKDAAVAREAAKEAEVAVETYQRYEREHHNATDDGEKPKKKGKGKKKAAAAPAAAPAGGPGGGPAGGPAGGPGGAPGAAPAAPPKSAAEQARDAAELAAKSAADAAQAAQYTVDAILTEQGATQGSMDYSKVSAEVFKGAITTNWTAANTLKVASKLTPPFIYAQVHAPAPAPSTKN